MKPTTGPATDKAPPLNPLVHPKGTLRARPEASIFPMLGEKEMKTLVTRMKAEGFNKDKPIVLFEGDILEGRNRYFASIEAGVPHFSRLFGSHPADGPSPTDFSIRENLERRHLTASERAVAAEKSLPLFEAEAKLRQAASQFKEGGKKDAAKPEAKTAGASGTPAPAPGKAAGKDEVVFKAEPEAPAGGKSAAKVAEIFGSSETMVKLAKKIKKWDPELYAKVESKALTVTAAADIMNKAIEAERAKKKAEAEKQQRTEALGLIGANYGEDSELYKAAKKGTILKDLSDLVEFASTPPKQGKLMVELVAEGWTLAQIKAYQNDKPTPETTLNDLINTAIVQGKGSKKWSVEVLGYTITVDGLK